MAIALMLPDGMAPSNLHLRPSTKVRYVDADMFNICERLAEVSPRLYALELTETDKAAYTIMESCLDGVQRQVYKLKKGQALDARVIEKVQWLLRVPFEHRLAAIEKDNAKFEADHAENLLEETYEKMGGEFRRELERCGFAERNISYPKYRGAGRAR